MGFFKNINADIKIYDPRKDYPIGAILSTGDSEFNPDKVFEVVRWTPEAANALCRDCAFSNCDSCLDNAPLCVSKDRSDFIDVFFKELN